MVRPLHWSLGLKDIGKQRLGGRACIWEIMSSWEILRIFSGWYEWTSNTYCSLFRDVRPRVVHLFSSPESRAAVTFYAVFSHVMHDCLSERGTHYMEPSDYRTASFTGRLPAVLFQLVSRPGKQLVKHYICVVCSSDNLRHLLCSIWTRFPNHSSLIWSKILLGYLSMDRISGYAIWSLFDLGNRYCPRKISSSKPGLYGTEAESEGLSDRSRLIKLKDFN